jgi:hypothetical protein
LQGEYNRNAMPRANTVTQKSIADEKNTSRIIVGNGMLFTGLGSLGMLHLTTWENILCAATIAIALEATYVAIMISIKSTVQEKEREEKHDIEKIPRKNVRQKQNGEKREGGDHASTEHQETLQIMALNFQKILHNIEKKEKG